MSPSRIVFAYAAGLALALLGTLLIATAVQTPAGTGVAVLALALALLIVGAIIAAYMGNTTLALAFLGAGALGTVGAIIKGARSQ